MVRPRYYVNQHKNLLRKYGLRILVYDYYYYYDYLLLSSIIIIVIIIIIIIQYIIHLINA
jgi:hypothetical protein